MKLQGSIHRFSLASVLQFLAQNAATGVLEVRDSQEYGFIYLVDGQVEGISLPITDELLGTRLLKAGCLSEQQLAQVLAEDAALTAGQKRLKPLGQRLVEKGFTSAASVREVMRRQILDEVFELAHWRNGVFRYDEPEEMPVFQLAIRSNVHSLLINAQRRIEQGERASKTGGGAGSEVCYACPLESDCSAAIKAKYLKQDVCLWRKMSALEDDGPSKPPDVDQLWRSTVQEPRPVVLDAKLGWD
ncbi:MAG: hypothetical protein A2133_00090 [Actinobacteria bacterium RBG_16_64_13]|nr:MAG: hypothetical protein A2133_00090 [Actinobacteria bacterium RBG_16_64_13]